MCNEQYRKYFTYLAITTVYNILIRFYIYIMNCVCYYCYYCNILLFSFSVGGNSEAACFNVSLCVLENLVTKIVNWNVYYLFI